MQTILSPEILTNTGAAVGFLVFLGYVAKQVIEWWRGDKSIEQGWRTAALNDAIAGHNILKELFNTLKEQVEELEYDLQESKRREADLISSHRNEIANLRSYYSEKVSRLEQQIQDLNARIAELEGGTDG